jgi:hypothetical protein
MKKFVLIVGIVALSTLMSASMASAQAPAPSILGTWEMISSGICLHSTLGWIDKNGDLNGTGGPPFTAPKKSDVWAGTATAEATWVFIDATNGRVDGTNYASIFPGGDIDPYVGINPFGFDFTYTLVGHNVTVTGSGLVMTGMISIDKTTMTLISAAQIQNVTAKGLGYLVHNNARVLIKVAEPPLPPP